MNNQVLRWPLGIHVLILMVSLLAGGGCRPRTTLDLSEPAIRGDRADAPQVFEVRWKTNHNYTANFYLDQSTQVRMRRTDEDLPVDMRLRLDFNGSVTNALARNQVDVRQWINLELTGLMFQLIRGDNPVVYYDTSGRIPQLEDDQRTTEALDKLPNNVQWRFALAEDGQVVGVDADMRQAKQALDHPSKPAGLTSLKRIFAPQIFRHYLDASMIPKNAVKIGDRWPTERMINLGQAGTVLLRGECVYRGWQESLGRRCARFDFEGKLASPTNTVKGLLQMARNNSPLVESGVMSGKIWFDPELGIPIQMSADLSVMVKAAVRTKKVVMQPPPPGKDRGTNASSLLTEDATMVSQATRRSAVPVPATAVETASAASVETGDNNSGSSGVATPVHQRMKLKIMDLGPR